MKRNDTAPEQPGRLDPGGAGFFPDSYMAEYNRFGGRISQTGQNAGNDEANQGQQPSSSEIHDMPTVKK